MAIFDDPTLVWCPISWYPANPHGITERLPYRNNTRIHWISSTLVKGVPIRKSCRHNPYGPISLQTRASALHFRRYYYGSIFMQILVMGSERNYCPSRSSKVIDFVINRSIATWTLSCTVSEIPTTLLLWLKFECSLSSRSVMLGSAEKRTVRLISVKLFSKNSNACDHSPPTLQTDGQTNGQTTYHGITALRYSSRGKKNLATLVIAPMFA